MPTSDARKRLLDQHRTLRSQLEAVVSLARRLAAGEPIEADFVAALAGLRAAFEVHNATEEKLLGPLLLGAVGAAGAVGELRVARMLEEHAEEHALVRQHLRAMDRCAAARMEDLAEELEAHMDAEERTFLSPAVIR